MHFDEYQNLSTRTKRKYHNPKFGTAVYAMGLAGEAGEAVDYLKKCIGHDHPLDADVVKKELGDVLWYVAALCDELGLSMDEVASLNVEKLKKRYPEGFTTADSIERTDTKQGVSAPCRLN